MQTSDNEKLMLRVRDGDMSAFEQLVIINQAWAWRVAYRFLGDKDEAADVIQDAFLRLLETSDRYQPTALFKTYMYQIITRLCLDKVKKKQPVYMETVPDIADSRPDVDEVMIRQERSAAVRNALDSLSPNQRMVIILRYYEELNYEQIASALEITYKAVERLLARGRNNLRTILNGYDK